jgi:hypothetical protein
MLERVRLRRKEKSFNDMKVDSLERQAPFLTPKILLYEL